LESFSSTNESHFLENQANFLLFKNFFLFLTAACFPKIDFYTPIWPHPHPPSKENATGFCTVLCLLVLMPKERQTCGKSLYFALKKIFLHTKKFVKHTKKNSICTAKLAIIHTFSGFGTLSELLAHFLGGMLLSRNLSKTGLVFNQAN